MKRSCSLLVLALVLSPISILADGSDAAQLPYRPWNGYWWPYADGALVTGAAIQFADPPVSYYSDWTGFFSPYEKYNQAFGADPRGEAWLWEWENHYIPGGPSWWGHCNGWAVAAALESEPVVPGEFGGVYFRIGDKKALLAEAHQSDGGLMFGTRFNEGDPAAKKEDIYADQFHRVLIQYIKENQQPIIVEIDAGPQIWNYPCYRYEMSWVDEGNVQHVSTTIYLAVDSVHPDTTGDGPLIKNYTYDLTLQDGHIVSGAWTRNSVDGHPDFLWEPLNRVSGNPMLDYAKVNQIVAAPLQTAVSDDSWESNDTPEQAAPMAYDVLFARLLNPDYFSFPVEAGETVEADVHLEKIGCNADLVLLAGDGTELVRQNNATGTATVSAGHQNADSDLRLGLLPKTIQTNFRNYGLLLRRSGNSFFMPHVVNADGWNTTMILYNPGPADDGLFFHFYHTENGIVTKQHYSTSLSGIAAGQMTAGTLDSFFPAVDPDNQRWLKIRTDGSLEGLFLFTNEAASGDIASMPLLNGGARELFFNHLAVDQTWWTGVSVANLSPYAPAHVTLQPVTPGGEDMPESFSLDIAGGGRFISLLDQIPNFTAQTLAAAGWIRIESDRDVAGFELFGTHDMQLFEGIPLQHESQTLLYAPWVPPEQDGWTGISIVNPTNRPSTIRITPYNKDGVNAYGATTPRVHSVTLSSGQKFVVLVDQLFPAPGKGPIANLKIEGTNEVSGFILYGSFTGQVLFGYPLAGVADFKLKGVCPYFPEARLSAANLTAQSLSYFTVTAHAADGSLLATSANLTIPVRSVRRWTLPEVFGGTVPPGIQYIRWSATKEINVLEEVLQAGGGTILPSLD